MSVPPTKHESQASSSAQDAPDDASLVHATVKDLSLESLVPKWSSSDTVLPIQEFFEITEGSAKIGNWSEADQIQVCAETNRGCTCVLQRHSRTAQSSYNLAGI